MCGLAGFTRFTSDYGDNDTLLQMGAAIHHRGPDANGTYLDDQVGLCHQRLSILDLSEAGTQPMHNADSSIVVVFNGEIYNFQELKAPLEKAGHQFSTQTDTEVILALYEKEGISFVEKLAGMFAIAIWDTRKDNLHLIRDRIGKKPLYYYHNDDTFVFGSEIKAILQAPSIDKTLRPDAIYDFFAYQYIPDPKSIYQHIHKIKPGHFLTINKDGFSEKRYWDITFDNNAKLSESEIKEELLDLIRHCTKQRMISDVPLGAFLSGGVDSSGIVALMAQQSDQVTTCSIGFDEKRYNETEFAQIVAKQYQTDHHEYVVESGFEKNLEEIAKFFDEPFADQSLVPTFYVSKLARQAVTVALAGDGGDEIFAGYEKYLVDQTENMLRDKIPLFLRKQIFNRISGTLKQLPFAFARRAGSLLHSLSLDPAAAFYVSNAQIDDMTWQDLVTDAFQKTLGDYHPSEISIKAYNDNNGPDHVSRILYTDMKTFLPGDILVKVDRMSMAHSLEVRAPLLDHRVIEYAARIPSQLKLKKQEKKYILKECFKSLLPDEILYRKKMGFSVPLASWLRHELKPICERELFAENSCLLSYFDPAKIRNYWDQHQSGKFDHSALLWSMLMFCLWFKVYQAEA